MQGVGFSLDAAHYTMQVRDSTLDTCIVHLTFQYRLKT
jgi:hypothetical protein